MRHAVLLAALTFTLCGADFSDRLTKSYNAKSGGELVFDAEYGPIPGG